MTFLCSYHFGYFLTLLKVSFLSHFSTNLGALFRSVEISILPVHSFSHWMKFSSIWLTLILEHRQVDTHDTCRMTKPPPTLNFPYLVPPYLHTPHLQGWGLGDIETPYPPLLNLEQHQPPPPTIEPGCWYPPLPWLG